MVSVGLRPPAALADLRFPPAWQSRLWYQGGAWHLRLQAEPLPRWPALEPQLRHLRTAQPLVLVVYGCDRQRLQPHWHQRLEWHPLPKPARWQRLGRLVRHRVCRWGCRRVGDLQGLGQWCGQRLWRGLDALQVPTAPVVPPRLAVPGGASGSPLALVIPLAIAALTVLTVDTWVAAVLPSPAPSSADPALVLGDLLQRYRQHPPDLLVVGSSRAIQGLDPQVLAGELAHRRLPAQVAILGVNGATARVVARLLTEYWRDRPLPRAVLWLDGARAFSPRPRDATEARLQTLLRREAAAGDRPFPLAQHWWGDRWRRWRSAGPRDRLTPQGFLALAQRFEPDRYYATHPALPGQFDRDSLTLDPAQQQAFGRLQTWCRQRQLPLLFIDAPLTDRYLDAPRRLHQERFHRWLAQQALPWRDYSNRWPQRYGYFADPSHLNRQGARSLAVEVAQDPAIPWQRWLEP